MLLPTSEFKRLDLTLSVFITKESQWGRHKETLGSVSVIFIVVMVLQVFVYVQTHQIMHIKYMLLFLYWLYHNKTI